MIERPFKPVCFVAAPDLYVWVNRHPMRSFGQGMPFGTFYSCGLHQVYCLN